MNPNVKFGLALAGVLAFLATAFGLIGAVIWGDLKLPEQAMLRNLVVERLGLLIYLLTIAAVAIGLALARAFRAYVRPPLKLAEDVRVLLAADGAPTLSPAGAPEFAPLVESINLLADRLDNTFGFSRDRSDVTTDRNNLEAYGIDQFLCFMGCPTDLEKNRNEEDEEQNQDCRNHGNTDGQ